MSQSSPVSETALAMLVKQYALDLRRNASGGDDYPFDFANGVADYLGVLIKRAKGDCTCARAGFPDSCDNCDAFGFAQTPAVSTISELIAWFNDRPGISWEATVRDIERALTAMNEQEVNDIAANSPGVSKATIRKLLAASDTSTVGNSQ